MTINEMFDELENKIKDTYIVTLKYKYDFEKNYTIENHILEYESITDSYVWLNDWYEGQTDVEVLGYMLLGDVDTTKLLTCDDCISREEVIRIAEQGQIQGFEWQIRKLCTLPSVTPQQTSWIPVSERLPEDLEAVNITWVNHEPEPYYHEIKDKNFIATGIHFRGKWYWYSTTCADYLGEYGENEFDMVDDAIEIIAWMPLPKPYEESEDEE